MSKLLLSLICVIVTISHAIGQPVFTRQDSLRGSITPERIWWDLTYYHLDINVDPSDSTIEGSNTIQYTILSPGNRLQVDLQEPLMIRRAVQGDKELIVEKEGNAHFISGMTEASVGTSATIVVYYGGKPQVSLNPPWSGGITWQQDSRGNPFIASSCQGIGASIWWPCKDHMYDEVDSMLISVKVPKGLMNVSNGRLRKVDKAKDGDTYHWFVSNPINNYGVNINIGDYKNFTESYDGEKGTLDCDYYVLRDNVKKAKKQFADASRTLEAFEHWFGPYPFYEDSYKLVEAPYLGMEHQSSVTYGNGYQNGYRGTDLSATGWGLKFDFIIIHESGHEWFANNITYRDIADMWIHESFTAYSENLFLDYHFSTDAGAAYTRGTRKNIANDRPIIGYYQVNKRGSSDMYYKGANMLHMIRQIIDNDELWRSILRGMNSTFYHQTVTTEQIETYIIEESGIDLQPVFDQYLRDVRIPILEYNWTDEGLQYRWNNTIAGFNMPVEIQVGESHLRLNPTENWSLTKDVKEAPLKVDSDYYVGQMIVD
jgi:aminopeptidase N